MIEVRIIQITLDIYEENFQLFKLPLQQQGSSLVMFQQPKFYQRQSI
jgi:hypothetical protein